jgi:hypothetical protein
MSIARDNRGPSPQTLGDARLARDTAPEPPVAGYSEADAILILKGFVEARARAVDAKRGQDAIADQLRSYLEQHRGRLVDNETGWEARLQEREGPAVYDVIHLTDELILEAARAGALNMDAKVIAALRGKTSWVDEAARYRMPGKPSQVLTVTKREG